MWISLVEIFVFFLSKGLVIVSHGRFTAKIQADDLVLAVFCKAFADAICAW